MTYKHNSLFVFDIETITDTEAVPHLVDDVGESLEERREALTQYHLALTHGKKNFPRQLFHRVVAISFLSAEIHRDGTYELTVRSFFRKLEKFKLVRD